MRRRLPLVTILSAALAGVPMALPGCKPLGAPPENHEWLDAKCFEATGEPGKAAKAREGCLEVLGGKREGGSN